MTHQVGSPGHGLEIAHYPVRSLIAQDSRGVVYRAHDVEHDRPVTLRLLTPELAAQEEFRDRFLRECRLAASVDHPNVLPVHEAGEWSGLLYVVMGDVRGTDLQAELNRRGQFPLSEAEHLVRETAGALDAAHAAGLVHRDVRPGTILLTDDGRVLLTGFGLGPETASTAVHAAPEQIRGEDVGPRADVYALASIAYTVLTGRPPFGPEDGQTRLRNHPGETPPRLAAHRPDVPATVETAILRGLSAEPRDRPASAGALADLISPGGAGSETGPLEGHGDDGRPPTAATAATAATAEPPASAGTAAPVDPHGASRHRAPRRLSVRARWLIVLGAALAVLLAAVVVLMRPPAQQERVTFRAEGLPYTLVVPERWIPRTHQAGDSTVSVLSAADLVPLFADDPAAPAALARSAADDPQSVVGLAIYHRPAGQAGQSARARADAAEALLPGREAYLVDRGRTTVGDLPGQVMEGAVQLPEATLQVRVLAVEAEPDQLLVFFAPPAVFPEHAPTFDEVAASLDRSG